MPALAGLEQPPQGDSPSATRGRAPRLLQDRVLSVDVGRVSVCARMRLAALVANGDTVAVQRLSWQRLATIALPQAAVAAPTPATNAAAATTPASPVGAPPPAPARHAGGGDGAFGAITALAWAPAAAALALGSDTGRVRVVPLDAVAAGAGAPAPADVQLPRPVTVLEWMDPLVRNVPAYDDRDHFFHAIHATSDANPTMPAAPKSLDATGGGVIAAGDDIGRVTLLSFNLAFVLATVQVLPPGTPVTCFAFPENMAYCVAAGLESLTSQQLAEQAPALATKAPDVSAMTQARTLVIRHVALAALADSLPEIQRAGIEFVAMSSVLNDIRSASEACREAWVRDAMGMLRERIYDPLRKLVRDFAEEPELGPWGLLQDAFYGGAISGALEQFLGSELGENGAKLAQRVLAAAADEVRKALHIALPQAQRMVFRASEYRGLALVGQSFPAIGVTAEIVDRVCVAAESVLELLTSLAIEVDDVERHLVAFLRWAGFAAARTSGTTERSNGSQYGNGTVEDNSLVAAFFDAVLAGELEYPSQGAAFGNLVIRTYAQFSQLAMTELTEACNVMFDLPTTTVTERLHSAKESTLRLPLSSNDVEIMPSIAIGKNFVHIVSMCKADHVLFVRCEQVMSETAWSMGVFQTRAGEASIRAVAHGVEDELILLSRTDVRNRKSSYSLCMVSYSELTLSSSSTFDLAGDPLPLNCTQKNERDVVEFCHVATDAPCSLLVDSERALACVLFGARRLVLFDLRCVDENAVGPMLDP